MEALLLNDDGSAKDRIIGIETEYGFACSTEYQSSDVGLAQTVATRAYNDAGHFGDGSRRYVDCGVHPEFSTAEEVSFSGLTDRLIEGHLKTAAMLEAERQNTEGRVESIQLVANTRDIYDESWGSHENLGASRALEQETYIGAMAVHNLSRIVWSGVGNVKRRTNDRDFDFTLSEKADHVWGVASTNTTRLRPLVNLRDETLGDNRRFRRIHNIMGETAFSPFVNGLRMASTSILLRACELGVKFDDLMPEDPVGAIRVISEDPSLKALVRLENGKWYSGLDLQKSIAERAIRAALAAEYITPQERQWALKWLQILDDLDDPDSCERRLDWVVKKHFIEREMSKPTVSPLARYERAFGIAVRYHRVLPEEGKGLYLLRKGFFENSPSFEAIEAGLALPETRAKVRGTVSEQMRAADIDHRINWDIVALGYDTDPFYHKEVLNDPYEATMTDGLRAAVEKALAA